ncbi:MAG TPA: hypothetical protein VE972_14910 [Conexibacter sp.]|nr:hypothetical protein [Conexibacter sp.]
MAVGMRIAVMCRPRTSNGRYRAILPLRELERRGHTILWPGHPSYGALDNGAAPKWDVLHLQQFFDEEAVKLVERARARGIAVVWDSDDNILAAPRGSESLRQLGGRRGARRHFKRAVEIGRRAQLLTTTNEHLAGVYREAGVEQVRVIENHLAPQDVQHRRRRHQGLVIGITAAEEHEPDLRKMKIGETLKALMAAHDGVRVVAIGADLKIGGHRYLHHPIVPFEQLIATESEWDVGLAPLRDVPFNHARSNVKLKEYGAAGAMWLASPVGPYVGMGESQGGLLVREGEWLEALRAVVEDRDRARALAARAREWAEGQTIRAAGSAWQAAFREAIERGRG